MMRMASIIKTQLFLGRNALSRPVDLDVNHFLYGIGESALFTP